VAWQLLLKDPRATMAAAAAMMIILAAIFAPLISPHDPELNDIPNAKLPPAWVAGGSWQWPLGTDWLGRDILSRTIYGARTSLGIATSAVALSLLVGVTLGIVSGYFGGWRDDVLMRTADIQLAIPTILLAVALAATTGRTLASTIVVLAVTRWVSYARIARGEALSLREQEFVTAARSIGGSDLRILRRHVLPNAITPILVLATIELALVVNAESALSFLGVGVQPPTATWGGMLAFGRNYLATAWWMSTFPGLALMLTVLSVNLLGDWLRDVSDPRRVRT
jgi:peptide/nickel transport system permease protein